MAEIYKFFNSAPGDVRTYQAADFADYFGDVLSSGLLHIDEIPGLTVKCDGTDLRTYIEPGKAVIKGYSYENTADLYLQHELSDVSRNRIDRIVLRLDKQNQSRFIKLFVKTGTAATDPVAPALQRDDFIYELSLAKVLVRANTASLLSTDITDERLNENLCGLVHSLITVPTQQFVDQWNSFFSQKQSELTQDQSDYRQDWETWFNAIQNDGFAMASDFNAHVTDDKKRIKVKRNIVFSMSGWSWDATTNLYKYDHADTDIFADSVVDVNIHLSDLIKAANLKGATQSFDGYVRLYANVPPVSNLNADLKYIRQVI